MPPKGAILLGEVAAHLAAIEISCNFCPRRGKASVLRLMHEHGSNMPIPDLLRLPVSQLRTPPGCPHRRTMRGASAAVGGYLRERADARLSAPLTLGQPSEGSLLWLAVVSPTGTPSFVARGGFDT
jgi:hypothetical protein